MCPSRYKNPGGKLLQRVVFTTTTTTTTAAPDWRVHMHRAKRMTQADVARRATVELARMEMAGVEIGEQSRSLERQQNVSHLLSIFGALEETLSTCVS